MILIFQLIPWLVLMFALYSSIKIIKEYQRAAVFRLGQFFGVRGPWTFFVIPFVDKIQIVDLNKWIPDWQRLSKVALDERVKSVALSHPGE
jgi:regulator of protease activity HflC (stomatin/prohibitin superfamily)